VARALEIARYHRAARNRALALTLHRLRAVQRVAILVGGLLTYLVATSGCYNPELRDCTVQCSAPTDCTGGQVCRADGFCAMPDAKQCTKEGENDANLAVDAAPTPTPDAPVSNAQCLQACTNGTCVEGVCVIDCSATSACNTTDVWCPAGVPCRVVCGASACTHKVQCGLSTSCAVQCNGDLSCQDEIICNTNRCDVDCIGAGSCKRRTKCSTSCACDVTCTGTNTCLEVAECPASTCRLGNGCTSTLTGCDSC
jgi:hypothetical protein